MRTLSWLHSRIFVAAVVGVVAAAGLWLRFHSITSQSLTGDELWSWAASANGLDHLWEVMTQEDLHPPGYQLLLYVWIAVFGDSVLALRSLSALAGAGAVLMMYLLGREVYSFKEGVLASCLMAFLISPIVLSQEARTYSTLLFTAATTGYLLAKVLREQGSRRQAWMLLIALCLASTVQSYLHYYGLFLTFLQGVFAIGVAAAVRRNKRLTLALIGCYAMSALLYLPWLGQVLRAAGARPGIFSARPPSYALDTLAYFVGGYGTPWAVSLAVAGIVFVVVVADSAGRLWRFKYARAGATVALLAWAVLPFVLLAVKSAYSQPVLNAKYFVISAPALYLLLARAGGLLVPRKLTTVAAVAVAAPLIWYLFQDSNFTTVFKDKVNVYEGPRNPQLVETHMLIANLRKEYPGLAVLGMAGAPPSYRYYPRELGADTRINGFVFPSLAQETYDKLTRGPGAVPVVALCRLDSAYYETDLFDLFAAGWTQVSQLGLMGSNVAVFWNRTHFEPARVLNANACGELPGLHYVTIDPETWSVSGSYHFRCDASSEQGQGAALALQSVRPGDYVAGVAHVDGFLYGLEVIRTLRDAYGASYLPFSSSWANGTAHLWYKTSFAFLLRRGGSSGEGWAHFSNSYPQVVDIRPGDRVDANSPPIGMDILLYSEACQEFSRHSAILFSSERIGEEALPQALEAGGKPPAP